MTDAQILATFLTVIFGGLLLAYLFKGKKAHPAEQLNSHVFLDLETLGIRHNAPVLVIAAYAVDSLGNKIKRDQWRVSVKDANKHGTADPSTMQWWSEQSGDAKRAAFEDGPRLTLFDALRGLSLFIGSLEDPVYVWGNAPTFDCAILRHAYMQTSQETPWEFWQERDCRTVAWVGEWLGYDAKQGTEFKGERHNALDDARHQARYTIDILNHIGGNV